MKRGVDLDHAGLAHLSWYLLPDYLSGALVIEFVKSSGDGATTGAARALRHGLVRISVQPDDFRADQDLGGHTVNEHLLPLRAYAWARLILA